MHAPKLKLRTHTYQYTTEIKVQVHVCSLTVTHDRIDQPQFIVNSL